MAGPKKQTSKKRPSSRTQSRRASTRTTAAKKKVTSIVRKRVLHKKKLVSQLAPRRIDSKVVLQKPHLNPILGPYAHSQWQSKATFNPTALFAGGKVHLIYRAIGFDDLSELGYATSSDGLSIEYRYPHPVYSQRVSPGNRELPKVEYASGGGGNGGCEDPRVVTIDDTVYMVYTSFDGWGSIRIALTTIELNDLINRKFKWKKPVFISPPGEVHKNWVIFPEKIRGKFAILHGISPEVMVEYVDDLKELNGTKFIKSKTPNGRGYDASAWDNKLRGVGPAPIKTKHGWLVFYHAMDARDPDRYKLGAMLLDLKDPTKIIVRSKLPILEPDECYENEGFKAGVVYSCGAVVVDKWLFVYYGGADTVVCVATAELEPFLQELLSHKTPKFTTKAKPKK